MSTDGGLAPPYEDPKMSDDPFVVYAIERHTKMSTDKKARYEIFRNGLINLII